MGLSMNMLVVGETTTDLTYWSHEEIIVDRIQSFEKLIWLNKLNFNEEKIIVIKIN